MTHHAKPEDQDHELVDRLLTLHPPVDEQVAVTMDLIRAGFVDLAHHVVEGDLTWTSCWPRPV